MPPMPWPPPPPPGPPWPSRANAAPVIEAPARAAAATPASSNFDTLDTILVLLCAGSCARIGPVLRSDCRAAALLRETGAACPIHVGNARAVASFRNWPRETRSVTTEIARPQSCRFGQNETRLLLRRSLNALSPRAAPRAAAAARRRATPRAPNDRRRRRRSRDGPAP